MIIEHVNIPTSRVKEEHGFCFSHLLYLKDGEKRLRMKFYVSGSRKRATVHLEMREVSNEMST